MIIWAIVPVKPLIIGKSRLSGLLSSKDRFELNKSLLNNTLQVLKSVNAISRIIVISRDPFAFEIARNNGADYIIEIDHLNLNKALERVNCYLTKIIHLGVLIIPTDLPLISANDLEDLLNNHCSNYFEGAVISHDGKESGTNSLFLNPPGLLSFEFGPGSYSKFVSQCKNKCINYKIFNSDALAFDLDEPIDYFTYISNYTINSIVR